MTPELAMVIWAAAFAAFLVQAWHGKTPVAGLVLCYWLNLASVHLITEVLCLFHQNTSMYRAASGDGFALSGYAVLGLMAGNLVLARPLNWLLSRPGPAPAVPRGPGDGLRLAQASIVVGMVLFLVGNVLKIPSLSAVTFGGNMLAAGGFAWWWWDNYRQGRYLRACGVLAASLAIPFLILTFRGFLSYGVAALFLLGTFVLVHVRRRALVVLAAPVALYVGLSVSVVYFHGRGTIRQAVWFDQAPVSERVRVIAEVFGQDWQWFDVANEQHRLYLDERLDQNYFVGLAAWRLENREMDYAGAETVRDAALSMVPRLLWRDKPVFVGGSDLMSRFTGLTFAEGFSFGLGHVLEFYVSFGIPGLLVGFTLMGTLIGLCDIRAGQALRSGREAQFLLWFVPATALLKGADGTLAEATGSFCGFLVLSWAVVLGYRFLQPRRAPGSLEPPAVAPPAPAGTLAGG
jgi:hypothetical protein